MVSAGRDLEGGANEELLQMTPGLLLAESNQVSEELQTHKVREGRTQGEEEKMKKGEGRKESGGRRKKNGER